MIKWDLDYKIIDMHTHMGLEYCLYYPEHDVDAMVNIMDEAGVESIISSPCEDLFDGASKCKQITDAMTRYPDRIKGYFAINPCRGIDVAQVDKAFRENQGYVGLKFLPDYHRTELTDKVYGPVFEYADQNNMLVLSHTWGVSMNDESCNSADKVVGILDKYKNITFIMGHSIQGQVDIAIDIACHYENAYLDLCDTGRLNGVIEKMVARAGAHKIVFGTDFPMQGYSMHLGAVLGAKISDEERRLILRDNALGILDQVGYPNVSEPRRKKVTPNM